MTFKTGMISAAFLIASSIAGAQSTLSASDIKNSMLVFRNFEALGRAEKASLLKQTAVLHLEVREGQNKGDVILRRTQDITNLEHGILYEMIPSNIDMGDKHLISRMSYAWNAELSRYNQCRTDKIFCDTLSVSEKNYIVTPVGLESVNGISAVHFTLQPRKQYEGMVKGDIWINSQTSHVVRETGSAVALSKFVRSNSYERTYTEVNGEVVPLRQIYHVSAVMVGTFDAVYDYSEVQNIRGQLTDSDLRLAAAPATAPVTEGTATVPAAAAPLITGVPAANSPAIDATSENDLSPAPAPVTPTVATVPTPLTPHSFGSRLRAIFSHLK